MPRRSIRPHSLEFSPMLARICICKARHSRPSISDSSSNAESESCVQRTIVGDCVSGPLYVTVACFWLLYCSFN